MVKHNLKREIKNSKYLLIKQKNRLKIETVYLVTLRRLPWNQFVGEIGNWANFCI